MGFLDQMKQLQELKSKMDDVKKRLDTMTVSQDTALVKVTANGNRKITAISYKSSYDSSRDTEALIAAINSTLEQADSLVQSEMKGVMPNIPGLG
jgi:DNA-binding protein YbaB